MINTINQYFGDEHSNWLVEVKLQKDKYLIKCAKYIGSAILSYSKILMLDFVYNCLHRSYNEKEATLLYTDTDTEPGSAEPLEWRARTNPAAADGGVSAGA